MTTVFPCYAEADRQFASDLADYLARDADIRVFLSEGEIGAGESLTDKARQGRMADVIAVLFSPDSVPSKWIRADWEEAFVTGPEAENVRIGFLVRSECGYPAILRRQALFEDRRALKRWIRTREIERTATPAELEMLTTQIGDTPGTAVSALANEFAEHCGSDFSAVFWLRCGDRSLAQLSGELGWQMGLRLDGEPAANAAAIRDYCQERRFLLVLEDCRTPRAKELICGGQTSTLLTEAPVRDYKPSGIGDLQAQFASSLKDDWALACKLARRLTSIARHQNRFAEVFETMQALNAAAQARGDRRIREEATREQMWILEHWNRLDEARGLRSELGAAELTQMEFDF